MRVAGSKSAMGAAQRIVSMLPAHQVFVEAFAGSASVTRLCRPTAFTLLIERDPATAAQLAVSMSDRQSTAVVCGDSLEVLRPPPGAVVYCDPPYLASTRRSTKRYYRHEMLTDAEHSRFLDWAAALPCFVLISGYWSELYAAKLAAWRVERFTVPSHTGSREECVWLNYPPPAVLHDSGHVGASFTDRQRIKRKAARWVKMLEAMPPSERSAVLDAIDYASFRRR